METLFQIILFFAVLFGVAGIVIADVCRNIED